MADFSFDFNIKTNARLPRIYSLPVPCGQKQIKLVRCNDFTKKIKLDGKSARKWYDAGISRKNWMKNPAKIRVDGARSRTYSNARNIRCNNFTEKLDEKSARKFKFKIISIINECNILTCTVSIWQKTSSDIPVPWGLKRNNKKDAYLFSRRSFKWYFVGML